MELEAVHVNNFIIAYICILHSIDKTQPLNIERERKSKVNSVKEENILRSVPKYKFDQTKSRVKKERCYLLAQKLQCYFAAEEIKQNFE